MVFAFACTVVSVVVCPPPGLQESSPSVQFYHCSCKVEHLRCSCENLFDAGVCLCLPLTFLERVDLHLAVMISTCSVLMLSRMLLNCGKTNTIATERFEELYCRALVPQMQVVLEKDRRHVHHHCVLDRLCKRCFLKHGHISPTSSSKLSSLDSEP